MGEAERRRAKLDKWIDGLSGQEKTIYNVCKTAFEEIIVGMRLEEGCYLMSAFLTSYLKARHGITVVPVVGYVNDGTDEVMISHAWIEYRGKKCDLTLVNAPPQPKGPLLILDEKIRSGSIEYSYRLKKGEAAMQAEAEMIAHDNRVAGIVRHKEAEHAAMLKMVRTPESIKAYLDAAPDGLDYQTLSAIVDASLTM